MDSVTLSEEIKELKRLKHEHQYFLPGEFYEDQLKLVGIEMCDLGDDIHNLLDEAVELQRVTNLHDLRQSNLETFYYKKKKKHIDNEVIIAQFKNEIKKQQQEIEKEQNDCSVLEKFITAVNKRLVSDAKVQLDIETSTKSLQEHLDSLNIPEDFNIDELIRKVDLLKTEKSKEKK